MKSSFPELRLTMDHLVLFFVSVKGTIVSRCPITFDYDNR